MNLASWLRRDGTKVMAGRLLIAMGAFMVVANWIAPYPLAWVGQFVMSCGGLLILIEIQQRKGVRYSKNHNSN